jgi:hypothetical protein
MDMEEKDRPGYWNEVYGNPSAGRKEWARPERFCSSPSRLLCTLLVVIFCLASAGVFVSWLVKFQREHGTKEVKIRAEGLD